jgi:predicted transcriptional regulator of viral defense system
VDFIEPLMRALGRGYYVSLLSAAEVYGASHQRPQVFQVMVDRQTEARDFGRVRVRFYLTSRAGTVPTTLRNSATGQYRLATPATACLDLATRPNDAGGLDNVATVLSELVPQTGLHARDLADAAAAYPVTTLRRLGWLLELVESEVDMEALHQTLTVRVPEASRSTTLLDPAGRRHGKVHPIWKVVENCRVEPDL